MPDDNHPPLRHRSDQLARVTSQYSPPGSSKDALVFFSKILASEGGSHGKAHSPVDVLVEYRVRESILWKALNAIGSVVPLPAFFGTGKFIWYTGFQRWGLLTLVASIATLKGS
jgi:hypothetical protein